MKAIFCYKTVRLNQICHFSGSVGLFSVSFQSRVCRDGGKNRKISTFCCRNLEEMHLELFVLCVCVGGWVGGIICIPV